MTLTATPVFGQTPKVSSTTVTAANTKSDGAGTVATDIFKAASIGANGAAPGARVRFIPTATAAATVTAATTARVFVSTVGSSTTSSADTYLVAEVSLPAITADHSTTAVPFYDVVLPFALPANSFIHVTNHVAPNANTAWRAVASWTDL